MDLTPEERHRIYEEEKARQGAASLSDVRRTGPLKLESTTFGQRLGEGCAVAFFACGCGTILCFIFPPVGILVLLFALVAPFVGALGLTPPKLKGACLHCGGAIRVGQSDPGVTCPECKRRMVVRNGELWMV
jgi:hypothetical protein